MNSNKGGFINPKWKPRRALRSCEASRRELRDKGIRAKGPRRA